MSLASALLKRAFIAHRLHAPWRDIAFARAPDPVHGKPCYVAPDGTPVPDVTFNVSHQAGLVALVGWGRRPAFGSTANATAGSGSGGAGGSKGRVTDVELGVDVVCVNERNDYRTIDGSPTGFAAWLDIYADFFSPADLAAMNTLPGSTVLQLPDGTTILTSEVGAEALESCCSRGVTLRARRGGSDGEGGTEVHFLSDVIVEEKLRLFYTFWCLKEAYIKLTGEAMLAGWLREVEFRNVRAPRAAAAPNSPWGEKVQDIHVYRQGALVADVKLSIQAFEADYMVAVAVRGVPEAEMPAEAVQRVALEDVLRFVGGA
ncbi:uncharacterized protein K452DRAFT_290072 [Aplosporella prunicola CBS 121167]|uniref:holo-[acyl-carrier-protein] synthase n=1 Tax=Aplosporella prunicola CBS 121167 TaxID=1176127 RepID=A0A6A6B4L2_9PEZI|nr:uncharacterized protein K452DRAFT_290072 [Aplosporella prunicola CBS 121167]KAF2138970.1 hypothetical protein K452DRAFT_290072 [Aplosporella prunicola CBS 121167]